jgi:Lrp/AsnC family transcriptional regulator, leucine-responsive regulatory protein
MADLDRIDRRILDILQRQGRISMTDLAEQIGLSTSPCTERVRRMEREGVITGYRAQVDAGKLGQTLLVYIEITLSSKSGDVFEKVRRELANTPAVLECHLVSGAFDYLVKVRVRGMDEYRQLLGDLLRSLPVAAESRSHFVMEEIKEGGLLATDR